ncbi:MAG: lysine--tRNA ligase [Patescibacteria group bacterium]
MISNKPKVSELDEKKMRLKRLENIKNAKINPYPEKFDKKQSLLEAKSAEEGTKIQTAGRIMTIRLMGKIVFCHVQDWSGKMQVVLKEDEIGKEKFKFFNDNFDMGDFVGVEGEVFKTQTGEISILVKDYQFLGKALLPLPEKWHGIKDVDTIYRQRYLDLLMNEDSKKRFQFRSNFIRALREFYWQEGFNEVETATFLHQATGATATPYKTHNNALDIDLVLRISLELPLKELIVGGMEKIFEIGKAFRNEGVDPSHLPEHTSVEHYCAYWNFEDNIRFTEKMFDYFFNKLGIDKKIEVENRDGEKKMVDFATPWKRVDFVDMLKKDTGLDVMKYDDSKELLKDIKKKKIEFEDMENMSLAGLVDNLYKKVSRSKIVGPIVLFNYPKYLQPLARINDKNDKLVDQFQIVVNGWEMLKAYSELVDPLDQKERFDVQKQAKDKGEGEVMEGDDEFITALEHGAPPISGWGMGIDRVVAILTGQNNLRDVVLFPLLRPLSDGKSKIKPKEDGELGLDYKQAVQLLDQYIKDPIVKLHCVESEYIMRDLAKHFGQDEEKWGIIGLLHDIDWDLTKSDPSQHCLKAQDILKQAGASDYLIETIVSHCYGFQFNEKLKDLKRETRVQYSLAASETLTGLIIASALIQPDKKLASLSVESLKKKFKNLKFAGNCSREMISECEQAGIPLDEFLDLGLRALQKISDKLGL